MYFSTVLLLFIILLDVCTPECNLQLVNEEHTSLLIALEYENSEEQIIRMKII